MSKESTILVIQEYSPDSDVWKKHRRRGARQEGSLVREDSKSRGEKVNEKVVYFNSFYYDAGKLCVGKPCVLLKFLGLRSRIYENTVES